MEDREGVGKGRQQGGTDINTLYPCIGLSKIKFKIKKGLSIFEPKMSRGIHRRGLLDAPKLTQFFPFY